MRGSLKMAGIILVFMLTQNSAAKSPILSGGAVFEQYSTKGLQRGGTLRTAILPVRGLDPHQETGDPTAWITNLTYNTLLRANQKGTGVEGDLARSWRQKDPLTWEIVLHKGVRFHNVPPVNGRELTSADVKYSLERLMGKHGKAGKFKHRFYFTGEVTAIETPDPYTVVIRTKRPYAPLLNYIASSWSTIVPREVVEKHGDLQRVAVGTGPFIMTEYVKGTRVRFRRNPDYFKKGLPYLDGVNVKITNNPSSALAGFLAGKYDIMGLYFFQLKTVMEKLPDTTITSLPGAHMWILRTPPVLPGKVPAKKPFDDVRVRRALGLAIDKPMLLKLAWGGFGEVQTGPLASPPWALPDTDQIGFNPERAKKLLAEAGYPNGFETTMMTWNAAYMVKPAQVVQQMLAKIGVKVKIETLEFAQYFNKSHRFKYDLALTLHAAASDPEGGLAPFFGREDKATVYHWPNKEVQDLIYEQASVLDKKKRIAMVHDIQRRLIKDAPMTYLYTQTRYRAIRPWLHVKLRFDNLQGLYAEEWWMGKPDAEAAH